MEFPIVNPRLLLIRFPKNPLKNISSDNPVFINEKIRIEGKALNPLPEKSIDDSRTVSGKIKSRRKEGVDKINVYK